MLAEVGHDGKVLAGGQSLIPMLNMRLASPGSPRRHQPASPGWTPCRSPPPGCGWCAGAARRAGARRRRPAAALPLLRQALRTRRPPGDPQPRHHRGLDRARRPDRRDAGGAGADRRLWSRRRAARSPRDRRRTDFFLGAAGVLPWPQDELVDGRALRAASPPGTADGLRRRSARRHGDYALAGVAVAVEVADGVVHRRPGSVRVGHPGARRPGPHRGARRVSRPTAPTGSRRGRARPARVDPDGDIHATPTTGGCWPAC